MLLRETTQVDPAVAALCDAVAGCLGQANIPYRVTGGLLLNQYGVGRPTFDVDIIVPREQWQKAVTALLPLSVDSERMGAPHEPAPAALLKSRQGPFIEIFPEGITAGDIAKLRGTYRSHPAAAIALKLEGDALVNLIDSKLASHLSATDRLQDMSDVQRLIKQYGLGRDFGSKLDRRVRNVFLKLVRDLEI